MELNQKGNFPLTFFSFFFSFLFFFVLLCSFICSSFILNKNKIEKSLRVIKLFSPVGLNQKLSSTRESLLFLELMLPKVFRHFFFKTLFFVCLIFFLLFFVFISFVFLFCNF